MTWQAVFENPKLRKGSIGTVVNVDGRAAAQLFEGARVRVVKRHYPDAVVVEFLDSGAGWSRGQRGEIPLRYFAGAR